MSGLLNLALASRPEPPPEPPPDPYLSVLCEISVSLRAMAKDIGALREIAERAETGERRG